MIQYQNMAKIINKTLIVGQYYIDLIFTDPLDYY
jgi:hypothetical protein